MKDFFQLNKSVLIFAYKMCALIFTGIIAIIITCLFIFHVKIEPEALILMILSGPFLIPSCIIIITCLRGLYDFKIRRRNFGTHPFSELHQLGFTTGTVKNNEFGYLEEVLKGSVNGYAILCEVNTGHPNAILVQAFVKKKLFLTGDLKIVEQHFKNNDIFLNWDGLTKMFNVKKSNILNIKELEQELIKFTNIIKHEGFEPTEVNNS